MAPGVEIDQLADHERVARLVGVAVREHLARVEGFENPPRRRPVFAHPRRPAFHRQARRRGHVAHPPAFVFIRQHVVFFGAAPEAAVLGRGDDKLQIVEPQPLRKTSAIATNNSVESNGQCFRS